MSRRLFTWAELEWIEFCARRGIPLSRCAAAMPGRQFHTVLHRAQRMGLSFQRAKHRQGPTWRHPDPAVRAESARRAAIARWHRLRPAA